jgi:hypothetical protein
MFREAQIVIGYQIDPVRQAHLAKKTCAAKVHQRGCEMPFELVARVHDWPT